jgi:acetylornithine deacetylase/succinyl-diaminopimelate desuccinylase-like protein
MLDTAKLGQFVDQIWGDSIVPTLVDYIRIPNKSPAFDPDWAAHGHMEEVVAMFERWARERLAGLPGATLEIVRLPGRTPLILIEVPGSDSRGNADTVLLYGHLDKQPEMTGWAEGHGPWTPVMVGDKLYGRGGADDGYAIFASLAAILALAEQGVPHARAVILIEACEESGSYDLPYYVEHLSARIGSPSLVICLDSGCANYDQLWLTTSLRGMAAGTLTVEVLEEGVHSGDASGVVPSSFRILRRLLSRIEDEASGEILVPELHAVVPTDRRRQAEASAAVLGATVFAKFPFAPGMGPLSQDPATLVLNRTWRPWLEVIGMDGVPSLQSGGNVLRPSTAARLSLRLPPTVDGDAAAARVKQILEADPPHGARVRFSAVGSTGWNAPAFAPWLEQAMETASRTHFGKPVVSMGEGGSIPFMAMLGERFPAAQFLVTGVLGPGSNAHGPNEFLHLPTAERVTACVADVLAAHSSR